jgi:beta-barrel assembly-enhancing protease
MKTLFRFLPVLLLACLPLVSSCQIDPLTGKRTFNIYGYQTEKELGDAAVQPIIAQLGGLYPDAPTQRYVNQVGQRIVEAGRTRLREQAEFPDWEFNFYVVNSSMINAFALPGGHIFITRGILLRMNDEAELAGLLGHEATHVFGRHGTERMSQQIAAVLTYLVVASTSERLQDVAVIGMVGYQFYSLSYSRSHESEADAFGMRFAVRAGYHPDGIINVMRMLDEMMHEHGSRPPEFMSTHPDPGNRVRALTEQMNKEYRDTASYVRNQPQFYSATTDMRAAQPAYDIADRGDALMAEGFKAQEEGNSALAKQKYEQALAQYQQAAQMRGNHAILHVNVAQALYYLQRFDEAEQSSRRALSLEARAFWPNFMGGMVAFRRGDYAAASQRLDSSVQLVPDSPTGTFYLAQSYDQLQRRAEAITYYRRTFDIYNGQGPVAEQCRQRLIELGEPDPAQ